MTIFVCNNDDNDLPTIEDVLHTALHKEAYVKEDLSNDHITQAVEKIVVDEREHLQIVSRQRSATHHWATEIRHAKYISIMKRKLNVNTASVIVSFWQRAN